ncbi:hypothetical protein ACIPSA_21870 [Streptomyces sp. NPDC086549]|uniref:hypothetical protein n=1 Tax=Streptomyces sp. NPDC086549 TaxID=3365752 RepID=UPI00382F9D54
MSTTPQMSHLGQQFPTTSPQQQPYPMGTYGMGTYGMGGSLEQLQQLGQQQPYQQLAQQLGQQQGQGEQLVQQQLQQVTQAAIQQVSAQVLQAGVANGFIDIVQPLPGQPQQIFLRFPDGFRVLNNPTQQAHDEIQEAFAFGHQVIGVWDSASPAILRSVRVQKL